MDVLATVTSKGQITIPKRVREALGLEAGDTVLFAVESGRAVMARTPDLLDLAGLVPVDERLRGVSWEELRRRSRMARSDR